MVVAGGRRAVQNLESLEWRSLWGLLATRLQMLVQVLSDKVARLRTSGRIEGTAGAESAVGRRAVIRLASYMYLLYAPEPPKIWPTRFEGSRRQAQIRGAQVVMMMVGRPVEMV